MNKMIRKSLVYFLYFTGLNNLVGFVFRRRVFCIGYHSIHAPGSKILDYSHYSQVSIDADLFEKKLCFLLSHGHTFLRFSDLGQIVRGLKINKPTLLYFDDGFKDNVNIVLPILKKYNLTATFFVVPAFCGQNDYMNWDEIRSLRDAGMEIGSHTYHHLKLTEQDDQTIMDELVSSKVKIEEEIGETIESFSYPKGRVNKKVASFVKVAGFKWAIATRYGVNSKNDLNRNPYLLKKIAPRVYEGMVDFMVRLYSLNIWYDFNK